MISALVDDGDDLNPIPEEPVQRRVVRMIQEHLEETGGADMSPAELARMSGYSKSHFMGMFKRLTGTTLQEYLDDCRWRKALEMQARGYARCNIAANLGFSCPASFSRWFRKQREKRGEEEPVKVARRKRQERQEANVVRARIID